MQVTFLGSGTSDGVPLIGCGCATCLSPLAVNKRLRASILLEHNNRKILIDVSTDFRQQALTFGLGNIDAILFTHADADHTSGIPELRAINWISQASLPIYAQKHPKLPSTSARVWAIDAIYAQYRYAFNNEAGKKGRPSLIYHNIKPYQHYTIADMPIETLSIMHGDMPILAFKVGRFAYITDASEIPPASLHLLQGNIDTLVINATRYRPHPRHLHVEAALHVAAQIGAKQTYLTHISHDIEHDDLSKKLPSGVAIAFDGLTLQL
jgi:phosphoribosyl 1,2-cyclic phosphate phosphodiesterase